MRTPFALIPAIMATVSLATPAAISQVEKLSARDLTSTLLINAYNSSGVSATPYTTITATVGALATVSASVAKLSFADATDLSSSDVVCRAYRDSQGQEAGSALFSQECAALITTQQGGDQIESLFCERVEVPH